MSGHDTDPLDLAWREAYAVLECLGDRLTHYGAEACRTFVAPGGPPAWDACGAEGEREGQAWVQVAQVYPSDAFPTQQTGAMRCPPTGYAVQLNVAILRCAAVPDEQGRPPSSERLTADAHKVSRDRAIVRDALRCCYLEDADPGTYVLGAWTPLGPQGGCVGGQTALTVALASCRCPDPPVPAGGFGLGPFGEGSFGGEDDG